jgi:hypothetical protein
LFVALQMLLAFGAGELHFVHRLALWLTTNMIETENFFNREWTRMNALRVGYCLLPIGYSR